MKGLKLRLLQAYVGIGSLVTLAVISAGSHWNVVQTITTAGSHWN